MYTPGYERIATSMNEVASRQSMSEADVLGE